MNAYSKRQQQSLKRQLSTDDDDKSNNDHNYRLKIVEQENDNKNDSTVISTTTPSSSTFSLLPNELLFYIFVYLKSTEITEIFFNLNTRLNQLIFSGYDHYLDGIDLTDANGIWINNYLMTIQPYIEKLKLKQLQLPLLFDISQPSENIFLAYPQLHTIILTDIDDNNDLFLMYLEKFKSLHQLTTLVLKFKGHIHSHCCHLLFQANTHLKTINIHSKYIATFRHNHDDSSPPLLPSLMWTENFYIQHLHIRLYSLYQLCILFEYLLHLETIHVEMMPNQLSVGNEIRGSLVGKPTRKYLKKFSLNGFITTLRQFQILLTQFSSTLEYLSL
ncbi:unnamed protein product, partial [Didymodactylos carnosus]